jgi:hypothetical protein
VRVLQLEREREREREREKERKEDTSGLQLVPQQVGNIVVGDGSKRRTRR